MTIRKKDFQRIVSYIQEFLDRLSQDDLEAAELRDSFNYALWQMRNYYRTLRSRSANTTSNFSPRTSMLGILNPLTWKWLDLESAACKHDENYGFLSIHQAAKDGDVESLNLILTHDPLLVNSQDCMGRTALMYCAHYAKDEHLECIKLLLSFEANTTIKTKDCATVIHHAVYGGNYNILELILQNELQSINSQDSMGRTPVHLAVMKEETDCLKLLLDNNALYSLKDVGGLTPIMWACNFDRQYHLYILQSYYEREYNNSHYLREERDHKGRTAIHWTVIQRQSIYCLQSLLTSDTISLTDHKGHTVLHTAAQHGSVNACKYILSHHPDVINNVDERMKTALHLATLAGHGDVINLLLEYKARSTTLDNENLTALDIALSKKLHYCAIVLNSFNRQSDKDGFRTPLRPKNKFYPSKMDNKPPKNEFYTLQDASQSQSSKTNPISKPRSLTSPYPLSNNSNNHRTIFFGKQEKISKKVERKDEGPSVHNTEKTKADKEQNRKKYRNLLLVDKIKSYDHPQSHRKQSVSPPLPGASSRDGKGPLREIESQSSKDSSVILHEHNLSNTKNELGSDYPNTSSNLNDYNEQTEVLTKVPGRLIIPQELPSKSLPASPNNPEKNRSSPLNNISKEPNWLNSPRIRSFTTSEGTYENINSSKNNGSLNATKISSPSIIEPIKDKFVTGDTFLRTNVSKDNSDTLKSNSLTSITKKESIKQQKQMHILNHEINQNVSMKDKVEFGCGPKLLAPINRPKSRSFSGMPLG